MIQIEFVEQPPQIYLLLDNDSDDLVEFPVLKHIASEVVGAEEFLEFLLVHKTVMVGIAGFENDTSFVGGDCWVELSEEFAEDGVN